MKFIGKENEVDFFKSNVEIILQEFPELKDWIINNSKKIIDNAYEWQNILLVCQYFKQNPKPNFYIRELPVKVQLKVTYTEPGLKGDTATNVTKAATVSNGAEIRVPLFINEGDKVKIDTRTGDYVERVK